MLVSLYKSRKADKQSTYLALSKSVKDGLLDLVGMLVETHVLQHHNTRQKKSSRVGESLASDIGSGTVDGLEDGALVTNVSGRSKTKTTNQTGAKIGENVTVKVGHDENLVVVRKRVGDHLEAGVVEELGVKLNLGILGGHLAGSVEEETVGHLHDGGLVHNAHLFLASSNGVLESEAENALGGLLGDQLDGLDNAVNNDVLDARVFALGVLTNEDSVDIVVGGLVAGDRLAGTQVGEEVECTAESQVEGDVTLANGSLSVIRIIHKLDVIIRTEERAYSERALECDVVCGDALDGLVGDDSLAILESRGDVDRFPLDGCL